MSQIVLHGIDGAVDAHLFVVQTALRLTRKRAHLLIVPGLVELRLGNNDKSLY